MSRVYEELLKIKNSCRLDYFVMAVSYFFDIGYAQAKEITDEDIRKAEPNGIMEKSFVEWLMETARKFTEVADSAVEVVQFCMAEDIYDIKFFAGKLGRSDLENMVKTRISYEKQNPESNESRDFYETHYDCDFEDLSYLGFNIDEE